MQPHIVTFNTGRDFSYCCGSREVGSFCLTRHTLRAGVLIPVVEKTAEQYKNEFKTIMAQTNKGSLIATTIQPPKGTKAGFTSQGQWLLVNRVLRKAGWKKVGSYVNPNTRNTVLMWHFK
jgi:hypothetical protein